MSNHNDNLDTLFSLWSEEEKSNPPKAKARLLAELSLTETDPAEISKLWKKSMSLGFKKEALQTLTLVSNHHPAALAWKNLGWEFETSGLSPQEIKTKEEHDSKQYLERLFSSHHFSSLSPPTPTLNSMESLILKEDAAHALSVFLKNGIWAEEKLICPPGIFNKETYLPWWSLALHLGAVDCAELAFPNVLSLATQEDLDQALMVVTISQMHFANLVSKEGEKPSREKAFVSPVQPVHPEIASIWIDRLLSLGANPYQLHELDGFIDERIYPEEASRFAPYATGIHEPGNQYCAAHIFLHLSVWSDRLSVILKNNHLSENDLDIFQKNLKKIDPKKIPLDAWGRDPVSFVLSTTIFNFHHSVSLKEKYMGQTALEWLEETLPVWGDEISHQKYGWHPVLCLFLHSMNSNQEEIQTSIFNFLDKVPMIPLQLSDFQHELKSISFKEKIKSALNVKTIQKNIDTRWIFKEEGLMDKLTPHFELESQEFWSKNIQNSRDNLLKAFSGSVPALEKQALIESHCLRWEAFSESINTMETPPKKMRL